MSSYISSNENRLYIQAESTYGAVTATTAKNRIPAVKLDVRHELRQAKRKDKTGRTFRGSPAGCRSKTSFRLKTYMYGRTITGESTGYDALFESAFGNKGVYHPGGLVSGVNACVVEFSADHGLQVNQAVASGAEMRFVTAVRDPVSAILNAPFSNIAPGSQLTPTITFYPGQMPGSVSVFDYWSPSDAVHRVLRGAVVNEFTATINGDYHEFDFAGPAAEFIDSTTPGDAMAAFPDEPEVEPFNYGIIPGHLGQAWLGVEPGIVGALTGAKVTLKNNAALRDNEFGQQNATGYTAGARDVNVQFTIYEKSEDPSRMLYEAARQRTPISAMFQMGQASGQLFGMHMRSVVPEIPVFDDGDECVQWRFENCRAQGTTDDELVIAFA